MGLLDIFRSKPAPKNMTVIQKLALFIEVDNREKQPRLGHVSLEYGGSNDIFCEDVQKIRDKEALGTLIQALYSQNVGLRCAATAALGEIGDESVIPKLDELVRSDPRREVREFAVCALGKFDVEKVRISLEFALKDRSKYVRRNARRILDETKVLDLKKGWRGYPALTNIEIYQKLMKFAVFNQDKLTARFGNSYSRVTYGWPDQPTLTWQNIACIKDPRAVSVLIEALHSDVYSAATHALRVIRDDRAIPALENMLCNDDFGSKERYAALKALEGFDTEKINAKALRFVLKDKDDEVRWLASALYTEIKDWKKDQVET